MRSQAPDPDSGKCCFAYDQKLDGGQQPAQGGAEPEAEQFANTDLSRFARYYLACLGYDDTGISTFLTSKFGEPDYVELTELPLTAGSLADRPIRDWQVAGKIAAYGVEAYHGWRGILA